MTPKPFYHALTIDKHECIGCTHCMQICPTQAIRVFDGKAQLFDNRCIDCGECMRSCPVNAIKVKDDDFNKIYAYKHRILLVPSVLIGQFSEDLDESDIHSLFKEIGFHEVIEIDATSEMSIEMYHAFFKQNDESKPFISTFCPAVVRLIQVKFPSLIDNLVLVKAPLDLAAIHARKTVLDRKMVPDDVGIFYVTPCAAKIAAIKSPVGEEKSDIDGVINLNVIYNKICKKLVSLKRPITNKHPQLLKPSSLAWSLSGGEAKHFDGRCLAVDEIHNVIDFLEKIENEEITGIDFLELRACDHSCAGGILTPQNRFLTVERLQHRIKFSREELHPENIYQQLEDSKEFILKHSKLNQINARSMSILDDNVTGALLKIKRIKEIRKNLPGVDCGICGSPDCNSMAEDIVKGIKNITHCVFFQRAMERQGSLNSDDVLKSSEEVWGKNKLNIYEEK